MHDAGCVGGGQGVGDLHAIFQRLAEPQFAARERLLQRAPGGSVPGMAM